MGVRFAGVWMPSRSEPSRSFMEIIEVNPSILKREAFSRHSHELQIMRSGHCTVLMMVYLSLYCPTTVHVRSNMSSCNQSGSNSW